MDDPSRDLIRAIRDLHGCDAHFMYSVPVEEETPAGAVVWAGRVSVFDLIAHPRGVETAYAWSYATDAPDVRGYVAVLHEGPVDSPRKAVQAAVLAKVRNSRT